MPLFSLHIYCTVGAAWYGCPEISFHFPRALMSGESKKKPAKYFSTVSGSRSILKVVLVVKGRELLGAW